MQEAILNEILSCVKELLTFKEKVTSRLDGIDKRLGKIEIRLDKVEDRLDKIDIRLDNLESNQVKIMEKLYNLEVNQTNILIHQTKFENQLKLKTENFKEFIPLN